MSPSTVGLPSAVFVTLDQMRTGQIGPLTVVVLVVVMAAVIAAIVFVERGHRRVTVQYVEPSDNGPLTIAETDAVLN